MFKSIFLLLSVVLLITMAGTLTNEQQWAEFKTKHGKTYATEEEEASRFEIFKENLNKINEHNEKYERGEVTYTMGVNAFADLTPEEFKQRFTGGVRPAPPQSS